MLYGQLPEQAIDGKTVNAIKLSIPNPPKTAFLRLPTNEELLDFMKPEKNKEKAEQKLATLFNRLRVDEGQEFDEYEIESAVSRITHSTGVGYERVGSAYEISILTPFNIVKHTLTIPTQKQITLFRRSAQKNFTTAAITLYDELATKIEGYIDGIAPKDVPPYHKLDAVNQVFAALDNLDPILSTDPNS